MSRMRTLLGWRIWKIIKKLFKKSVLSGAIIALGLAVGYATLMAFQGLDAIRDNFDYILNLNTNKQTERDYIDQFVEEGQE